MNSVTAVAKDMEAAAVAWVCAEGSAFYCPKVTTDLVDGEILQKKSSLQICNARVMSF